MIQPMRTSQGPDLGPFIQVCLNGPRSTADSPAVPMSPGALAEAAGKAVAAGARDIHVHPKTPCGDDSLSERVLTPVLEAIRAVVNVPVGVTTGAWAEPDPARRVERIRSWTLLPDHASVNWHEPGAEAVAAALLERGIGVEAGIWSGTNGARLFAASPLGPRVLRVLAEVMDTDAGSARGTAAALLAELTGLTERAERTERGDTKGAGAAGGAEGVGAPGGSAVRGRPVLLHGEDGGAWPVLRLALERGLATRTGIEDTLLLPDGTPAASNAELVAAAREMARAPAAGPGAVRATGGARPGDAGLSAGA